MDDSSAELPVCLAGVQAAARRISQHAHITPVLTCGTLSRLSGLSLHFKAEIFQRGGAFKFRGACNSIFALSEEEAAKGVVTHSSGNHGAAVALAAQLRGIPASVVVPANTPQIKRAAIRSYGVEPIVCEATIDAREAACAQVQAASGAAFVPPYNHRDVIAGQGTIALEFLQQVPGLEAIIVPVSGGGMISGIAVAAKALKPGIKIIAAEPTGRNGAADVAACKAAGELVQLPKPTTICDGLEARLGSLTWRCVQELVDDVITISEEEVVAAMQLVMERMKVVVEPSGAAGVAAALSPQLLRRHPELTHVGVVLCGGNIDIEGRVPGFWSKWLLE
ncbi:serine racemase [Micractinium conductrix]|uniref:Serine racemase n=1 Tax=Micractinium conductrix TaxID=554055 RepID=A0A2P6VAN3_9CHLO|nr:serine racemase [Micractinium conductrix]|eukprot:PSC71128.1 serine racemase [Micractinium conductrix]